MILKRTAWRSPAPMASTRPPSSIPRGEILFAAIDFLDRAVCRSLGRRDNGPTQCLDGRSFRRRRKLFRNCTGSGTCAAGVCLYLYLWNSFRSSAGVRAGVSRFFNGRVRGSFSLVRLQSFLAQPQRFGSDFHELIVGNEFDGLFQIQRAEGNQANGFIGG